ncbi:alpha/beta fold hydrolase [Thalassotalea euphylliae]|uniref:alpha/beta fold hydrolase n=1 Tax=Thalassotalea euphylliae TaxID=1655234 RepID=UPI0036435688
MQKGIFVSGQGPAIVFIHGSLSSSKQWFPLVQQLSSSFTCINVDILGYGSAEKITEREGYNFDIEAKRINEAINEVVGEQGEYHLVGHSCGGAIALKLAVEAPNRVLSMTLYEPVAFHLLPDGSKEQAEANEFAQYVDTDDYYKAAEIFTNFWNADGFFTALPEKMQALMAADMPKVTLDFIGLMSESYSLIDVSKLSAPSLMMSGQYSPHLSQYLAKNLVEALPNATEYQVAAGHMAPISHADKVLPVIADFLVANRK